VEALALIYRDQVGQKSRVVSDSRSKNPSQSNEFPLDFEAEEEMAEEFPINKA
jgi:hypothetical protein